MFCPKCSSLLMPSEGIMKCPNCKHSAKEGKLTEKKKKEKKLEVIETKEQEKSFPTIKADCEKCGNNQAYFHTKQTRAADEPETNFFKCTKCGHQWREY